MCDLYITGEWSQIGSVISKSCLTILGICMILSNYTLGIKMIEAHNRYYGNLFVQRALPHHYCRAMLVFGILIMLFAVWTDRSMFIPNMTGRPLADVFEVVDLCLLIFVGCALSWKFPKILVASKSAQKAEVSVQNKNCADAVGKTVYFVGIFTTLVGLVELILATGCLSYNFG